jgi:hypothetical protein
MIIRRIVAALPETRPGVNSNGPPPRPPIELGLIDAASKVSRGMPV